MVENQKVRIREIPYVDLRRQHKAIEAELLSAAARVIEDGQFVLGSAVLQFEQQFAEICGTEYAVAVNSGTDALLLSLRALGVGSGDEVITVPNSFVATASAIVLAGATPVFVDAGPDYNLDPKLLSKALTSRTKAIIPVHLTGRPADMPAIMDFAQQHALEVVEDCAQAVAAEIDGQRVGSFGRLGAFSLHPLKTLNCCGDGGVVATSDAGLAEQLRVLRNLGHQTRAKVVAWGHNSRLDSIQAAFLLVKLKYLETWTTKRQSNARFYQQHLADLQEIECPQDLPSGRAVYHTFVIQCDRRDELKEFLAEKKIGTAIHYPVPIHLQPVAADLGYAEGSFPVVERQARRVLSLPIYPELDDQDLATISDAIHDFCDRY